MSQRTSSSTYKQQQREYEQKRIAHVDKQNAELESEISKLQNIRRDALSRDTYIDLDGRKKSPRIVPFEQKRPKRENYLPSSPSGLGKMLPWKKREYEQLYFEGERKYKGAERNYQKAKTDHDVRMNILRDNAFEHNQKIEDLKQEFAAGQSRTVEGYFYRVLNASSYPLAFPQKAELTYRTGSRQLAIEYDLPTFKAMPEVKAYRYVKVRDEVTQADLPQSQRKQLYTSVLAQIPLRTIHEIYKADRTEKVDTIIFNGYVKTIDPRTGKPGQFCLVAVSTTRHQFLDLNLELVDPQECIKGLNGRLSRKPEGLVAVDPIEPIGDDVTPVSLPKTLVADEEPRRADEIFHRVTATVSEDAPNDIPIPARSDVTAANASISTDGAAFVEQARNYVERNATLTRQVSFQQYWPTYAAMDAAQLQWYFYWRTELRHGVRLPTDLSYLFVHIYEAINLIGFESSQEAFNYLNEFWRYYRQLQPKLDRYLPDWIADFIVFHELAPNALDWYSEVSQVTNVNDQDFAIEAWVSSGDDFVALSNAIIFELANYNPTKSKFYKQYAEPSQLDLAYKRALQSVDDATRKEQEKSLFQIHQPGHTRIIRRTPFANAVHAYSRTEIEIASVHSWSNVEPLAVMLNSIVKYTDNVLREQAGYKYRVRGIQLTRNSKSAIEAALQPEVPKRELSIDHSEIEQLAKDSEAIRARLLAVEEPEREQPEAKEASLDEPLVAAARWIPEASNVASVPVEATSKSPAAATVTDWSRIGGRRKARAMLRIKRFAATGIVHPASRAHQSEQQQVPTRDEVQVAASGMGNASVNGADITDAPAAAGFLHRPEDTPADLLTDLSEIAHIMGGSEGKRSKLIAVMMENQWECSAGTIESEFPGEFINVILDEVNGIALEEIGDTLIFEEEGLWIILEEYHDEIEYILQHPEYLEA